MEKPFHPAFSTVGNKLVFEGKKNVEEKYKSFIVKYTVILIIFHLIVKVSKPFGVDNYSGNMLNC